MEAQAEGLESCVAIQQHPGIRARGLRPPFSSPVHASSPHKFSVCSFNKHSSLKQPRQCQERRRTTILALVTLPLPVFSLFLHARVGHGQCGSAVFPTKALRSQGSAACSPGKQSWPCRFPCFPGLSGLAHNPCEQQLAELGGEGLACFLLCCLSFQEAYVCLGFPPRRWGRSALSSVAPLVQQWCPRVGAVLRSTAVPLTSLCIRPASPSGV